MKRKLRNCLSLALVLSLSLTSVLPAFADEENGIANETIMNNEVDNSKVEKTDVNDIDNESTYEEVNENENNFLKEEDDKVNANNLSNASIEKSELKSKNGINFGQNTLLDEEITEVVITTAAQGEESTTFGKDDSLTLITSIDNDGNQSAIIKVTPGFKNGEMNIDAETGSSSDFADKGLDDITGNITVEEGVIFPDDSSVLFKGFKSSNIKLNNDTSNVTNMNSMFLACNKLGEIEFGTDFNTSNVEDMGGMFYDCYSLKKLNLSCFKTDNVTNMGAMFNNCNKLGGIEFGTDFNTSNVEEMSGMFWGCGSLIKLDLSGFKTDNVTNMVFMFANCERLGEIEFGTDFNTSNVEDMGGMFSDCSSLIELNLSGFKTDNVTSMGGMFSDCSSLIKLNVSGFNTGNITDMGSMFYNCSLLEELDVSGFNTGKVTNMDSMFKECRGLTELDVSHFVTTNVNSMYFMFSKCGNNLKLDLSSFIFSSKGIAIGFLNDANIKELKLNDSLPIGLLGNLIVKEEVWSYYRKLDDNYIYANKYDNLENFANGYDANKKPGWYIRNITDYYVTFNSNYEESSTRTQTIGVESPYKTLKENEFKRDGYTFIGWNTKADNTGDFYFDGDNFIVNCIEDKYPEMLYTALYAQWEKGKVEKPIETEKAYIKANDIELTLIDARTIDKAGVISQSEAKAFKITETGEKKKYEDISENLSVENLEELNDTTEVGEKEVTLSADGETKTIKVNVTEDVLTPEIDLTYKDFDIELIDLKDLDFLELSKAEGKEIFKNKKDEIVKEEKLEVNVNSEDLEKLKASTEEKEYNIRISATGESGTVEKTVKVNVIKDSLTKILTLTAKEDVYVNLSDLKAFDLLKESEAKGTETCTNKLGEKVKTEEKEVTINSEDLEKVKNATETGTYQVRLSVKNDEDVVEKTINVIIKEDTVAKEEKSVEIEASDFSTSIKELEKTKSLEKLVLEKSKAKAFYVEKNSLGEETKRKQIDVKINADDLEKLKATKKAGDYKVRLSAEEEDVNNDMTITVTVKKPSEKPSKETLKDKDKEKPLKGKTNKKSKNNSKTGITGVAGVAALLTVASGAYISSKRK